MANTAFKNIHHFQKYSQETRGTNEKEWILSPKQELCLYKQTQIKDDNTSTNAHYSECIYQDIASLIHINCAKTELAQVKKKKGIISYYFLKQNEELIDFNALIQNIREDFVPKSLKCKKTKEHYSIELILEAVKAVVYEREEYKKIRKKIIELIIVDALCDHYDRNPSNIALIRNYDKTINKQFSFSPIYDNGTSLCMSLPVGVAKMYLEMENGIEVLDNNIISKIGFSDTRGTSYKNLLEYIFKHYAKDAYDIVKNIEYNITEDNLTNIVFSTKYKNLDKYHKKLLLIKVLYNKNKILNLYKKYEFKEEKEKIKHL